MYTEEQRQRRRNPGACVSVQARVQHPYIQGKLGMSEHSAEIARGERLEDPEWMVGIPAHRAE